MSHIVESCLVVANEKADAPSHEAWNHAETALSHLIRKSATIQIFSTQHE